MTLRGGPVPEPFAAINAAVHQHYVLEGRHLAAEGIYL